MDARFKLLKKAGDHTDPSKWDVAVTMQTGENMNLAANGIGSARELSLTRG